MTKNLNMQNEFIFLKKVVYACEIVYLGQFYTVLLYSFKLWVPGISVTTMATTTPTVTGVNTVVDIINAGKLHLYYRLGIHRKQSSLFYL